MKKLKVPKAKPLTGEGRRIKLKEGGKDAVGWVFYTKLTGIFVIIFISVIILMRYFK